MMFGWLRSRRRKRILVEPFSPEWSKTLERNVYHFRQLNKTQREKVRRDLQIVVAEKNWEGCGGLQITDEIKVTIAGQIAILVLGFDGQYFDAVQSILVYPNAYIAKGTTINRAGVVMQGDSTREGEAWYGGPVIVSWADALSNGKGPGGHNLVIHEFAHQLDMLNGRHADGVPLIDSPEFAQHWIAVCEREYSQLCSDCEQGHRTVFDCYGTTNAAEFFAVATEAFFEKPGGFRRHHSELFDLFCDFYGVDPLEFVHVEQ
jgi:MtfA peptidase